VISELLPLFSATQLYCFSGIIPCLALLNLHVMPLKHYQRPPNRFRNFTTL